VLQAFKEVWARWVAGLVGIVVAGLTAFSNLSFSEDHRALRLKADRSDVILDRVELSLTHLAGLEEEDQRVLIDQVYADFRDLQRVFEGETSVTALGPTSSIGLSAPAWAAGTAPEWIKGQAADPKSVYFVGLGSAPSLAQARDESRRRAVADARTWLAEALKKSATPPDEIASLSDRAAGSATVVDTWFERGNDGNFRFFTLVRLSRAAAATDFRVFAAREQVQLPSSAYNSVQKDSGRSADYVANRQQTYEQLLTKTRSELGDDYAKLEEGRRLRREGRIDEAIALLTPIAERRPDAFVVWFNLGLAHASRARRYQAVADAETMQRERRAAESAYRRALALEPDQPVRDPSVYNSFGSFLLDTGREQEAIPLFERALELDASHALAARNLAAAKQKLAPPGP
jgi:tetratricopeptide (TPR) repeat protein